MGTKAERVQRGFIFGVKNGDGKIVSWHVKYRVSEMRDGVSVRVLKSHRLCDRDDRHFSPTCKAVQEKCDEFMRSIASRAPTNDQTVVSFWEQTYLPFIQEHKKLSTVSGYEQIWNQHLSAHFGLRTLSEYRTTHGSQFLLTLVKAQGLRTLNHIRSLMSGIFSHAVNLGLLDSNPIHDVKILGKVKAPQQTKHYTLEEAEDIISALVSHPDCQLVMALACFMGLRPGEIAALKWEDFDEESVHIRRAYVRGNVTTTKTPESVASLQMPNRVRLFFELWRQKCRFAERSSAGRETKLVSLVKQTGWVFENERGNPVNLKDMVSRTIRPVIEKAGLTWKSLYAGRRGAGTAIIGLTNGNYASAQELLRHKHMSTTLQFYKKQTQHALTDGIKALDAALASPSRTPM